MAPFPRKPKDALLMKATSPENIVRREQWRSWNKLAAIMPGQFKVVRRGLDFALFSKFQGRVWVISSMCEPIRLPPVVLRIVK